MAVDSLGRLRRLEMVSGWGCSQELPWKEMSGMRNKDCGYSNKTKGSNNCMVSDGY